MSGSLVGWLYLHSIFAFHFVNNLLANVSHFVVQLIKFVLNFGEESIQFDLFDTKFGVEKLNKKKLKICTNGVITWFGVNGLAVP